MNEPMAMKKKELSPLEATLSKLNDVISYISRQESRFESLIYTPRPCNCGDADKPQILTIQEHLTEITMQAERIGKNLSEHADTLERNLGGLKIE